LYTAVTRAKDKLYLIGFNDESFEGWFFFSKPVRFRIKYLENFQSQNY
jgi:ATP-dependent exoDNAse (exonuclease V) alpha subunit